MDFIKKFKSRKFWALMLSVAMVFSLIPAPQQKTQAATTYTKVADIDDVVTGNYIIISKNNYAVKQWESTYYVSGSKMTTVDETAIAALGEDFVWNLTVSEEGNDKKATLKDANGVTISTQTDSAQNKNFIIKDTEGTFQWTVAVDNNGYASFVGITPGDNNAERYLDVTTDKDDAKRFRAYLTSNTSYVHDFVLYRIGDSSTPTTETAKTPKVDVAAGAVPVGTKVTLTTTTADGTIMYAVVKDGTVPTKDGGVFEAYTAPITIDADCTLYAYTTKTGIEDSKIVPYEYITYTLTDSLADGTYFIYSPTAKGVVKYNDKAAVKASVGTGNTVVFDETTESGKGAAVFTVKKDNASSYYVIQCGEKYVSAASTSENSKTPVLTDELTDTEEACGYWTITKQDTGYTIVNKTAKYTNTKTSVASAIALEEFGGNIVLYSTDTKENYRFLFLDATGVENVNGEVGGTEEPGGSEDPSTPAENPLSEGTYFIYNALAKGVMSYDLTGGKSAVTEASLNADGKIAFADSTNNGTGAAYYDIAKQDDGTYLIKCGNKYLSGTSSKDFYFAETPVKTAQEGSYWRFVYDSKNKAYKILNASAKYKDSDIYVEYYNNFSLWSYNSEKESQYIFQFVDAASYKAADTDKDGYVGEQPEEINPLADGTYFIWHKDASAGEGGVMKYELTGGVAADVKAAISEDKKSVTFGEDTNNGEGAGYYQITRQTDGTYLIQCGTKEAPKYVSADSDENLYLADKPDKTTKKGSYWKISWSSEFNGYFLSNATAKYNNKTIMMEYYGSKGFCLWTAGTTAIYTFQFVDASTYAKNDPGQDGYLGTMPEQASQPESGKTFVIYNATGGAVIGKELPVIDGSKRTMGMAAAKLGEDGKLDVANGGLIFTVEKDSDGYYTLKNNGKYLVTGPSEELCLIDPNSAEEKQAFADVNTTTDKNGNVTVNEFKEDYIKWGIQEKLGGLLLKNKLAKWGSSVIYIEYFSGGFAGYSYKANDAGIFTFEFHEAEDTYGTGYVVNPAVVFDSTNGDANLGLDYETKFTLDDLGTIQSVKVNVTFEDKTTKSYTAARTDYDCSFKIPADDLAGHTSFTTTVDVVSKETATKNAEYQGTTEVEIKDEPVITTVTPAANAETGDNKRPTIEIAYVNIGDNATAELTLDGEAVTLTQDAGKSVYTYTPAADMQDGKVTAVATITRKDGKSTSKTWNFYIGQAGVHMYFGQIHSHTGQYSDGTGELADAYKHAMAAKDSDFTIVTDHSNYFDSQGAAAKNSIYTADYPTIDKSTTVDENGKTLNKWEEAKATAKKFDEMGNDFVAAYGYEMTWSGGPGHINVFNSAGIVSRNNTELNNKTNDAGMFAFYNLLVDANAKKATSLGTGSISAMFNHPGTTFGFFDSFTGYTPERDEILNLIEVGNGDGAVGSTSYFPSYEYYDMALSAGWHIAPTNGQDNHKGGWGDINTMRTVVLTDSFSEAGIYEAMAARHIYSTEDQNLSVLYHLDDTLQGGVIENYDKDKVSIAVTLSDADAKENLGYVYVIGENGKELYKSDKLTGNTADLNFELDNTSAYYYIKVVQADGDIAVTAPVWVAEVKGNQSKVVAGLEKASEGNPVEKQKETLTISLKNDEDAAAKLNSYAVTIDGVELVSKTVGDDIKTGESWNAEIPWTPEKYGSYKVQVSYSVTIGTETSTVSTSKDIYVQGVDYDKVVSVAKARAGAEKEEFTIEGYVTANASGYDKNTAFFDCIYVQDDTAGINIFPVDGNYQVGQKVRVHGGITYYNGEIELNVSGTYGGDIKIIDESITPVAAKSVTAAEAMSDDNIGLLMTISGNVTRIHEASGVIDRIYVTDTSGTACIYINGYIWNSVTKDNNFGKSGQTVKVGDTVTATGLGSVDVDELQEVEFLHRLRIRDRAEIEVTSSTSVTPQPASGTITNGSGDTAGTNTGTSENTGASENTGTSDNTSTGTTPAGTTTGNGEIKTFETVQTDISTKAVTASEGTDGQFYDAAGEKVTDAIVKTKDGSRYILDENGAKITEAVVVSEDGSKFITNAVGEVLTGQIVSVNGDSYYTSANTGKVATDKVVKVKNDRYVASATGAFVKGGFATVKGSKYYCAKNTGKVITGRSFKVSGKRYFAGSNGKVITSKWVTVGNKKYYCNKKGVVTKVKKIKK